VVDNVFLECDIKFGEPQRRLVQCGEVSERRKRVG
jgi:hypothetical protein